MLTTGLGYLSWRWTKHFKFQIRILSSEYSKIQSRSPKVKNWPVQVYGALYWWSAFPFEPVEEEEQKRGEGKRRGRGRRRRKRQRRRGGGRRRRGVRWGGGGAGKRSQPNFYKIEQHVGAGARPWTTWGHLSCPSQERFPCHFQCTFDMTEWPTESSNKRNAKNKMYPVEDKDKIYTVFIYTGLYSIFYFYFMFSVYHVVFLLHLMKLDSLQSVQIQPNKYLSTTYPMSNLLSTMKNMKRFANLWKLFSVSLLDRMCKQCSDNNSKHYKAEATSKVKIHQFNRKVLPSDDLYTSRPISQLMIWKILPQENVFTMWNYMYGFSRINIPSSFNNT